MTIRIALSILLFLIPVALMAMDDENNGLSELARAVAIDNPEKPGDGEQSGKAGTKKKDDRLTPEEMAHRAKTDEIIKSSIRYSILFGFPVNTNVVAMLTWDWGNTTKFRLSHEGWFGENTYSGGADKAAHMFSHYLLMRVFNNIFNRRH